MCDADVDGAHIRTLVLTFLFREMPDLIDAGYVYLGKAPLYKVKNGSSDLYIEKESELEEVLLRDKLEKIEVTARDGQVFKLTQSRWQKYGRLLKQYEGWASALRSEFGFDTVTFLEESQVLDSGATDADGVMAVLREEAPKGEPYETEVLSDDATEMTVRVIERKSGAASTYVLRKDMFVRPEYASFVRVHSELEQLAGTPPFDLRLGRKEVTALSFEELRGKVMEVAGDGVNIQRFKGLGEMNPDQLYDTTMDAERRTLQQVTVDDAAAADEIFSKLMGDAVEPRRLFIEQNARKVTNLDV
jgi:DNA gyrase subunit B